MWSVMVYYMASYFNGWYTEYLATLYAVLVLYVCLCQFYRHGILFPMGEQEFRNSGISCLCIAWQCQLLNLSGLRMKIIFHLSYL